MNGVYLRALLAEEYAETLLAYLREQGYDWDEQRVRAAAPLVQEKIAQLGEFPEFAGFLFHDVEPDPALLDPDVLAAAAEALAAVEPFTAERIEAALKELCERLGLKPRQAFQPIRVAVTGSKVSPGLYESLELLGREESLARLSRAAAAAAWAARAGRARAGTRPTRGGGSSRSAPGARSSVRSIFVSPIRVSAGVAESSVLFPDFSFSTGKRRLHPIRYGATAGTRLGSAAIWAAKGGAALEDRARRRRRALAAPALPGQPRARGAPRARGRHARRGPRAARAGVAGRHPARRPPRQRGRARPARRARGARRTDARRAALRHERDRARAARPGRRRAREAVRPRRLAAAVSGATLR